MREFSVRWQKFRSFKDTGWLEIRPITLVIGANASGKTSLIAPLLLLKQTVDSTESSLALKTRGSLFNAGTFQNLIFSHRSQQTLSLGIRYHYHDPKEAKGPLKQVGSYPPGVVELDFANADRGPSPVLQRYAAYDVYGRAMLERKRLETGRYSLKGPAAPKRGIDLANAVRRSSPDHFLFTADAVFREQYRKLEAYLSRKHRREESTVTDLKIEQPVQRYISTVTYVSQDFDSLLSRIAYVGPLRERPKRLYELSGEIPSTVGLRGESAPEIIFRKRKSELERTVNEWIRKFEFGFDLRCKELAEGAFNVILRRTASSPTVSLADTGFGLSQVLPLIVQGFYGESESLLIAEQPEIHLNPKLQTTLADLFVAIAKRQGGVLVETHSEHLILRLRRLVAEGQIRADDVALYFTEREHDESRVREVPIMKNGHIPDWPKGFFGETLRESLALAAAQDRRRRDA